ncbi:MULTISPECIES: hypothetical protein [Burkholderia]|uniref:hypothetical protein n=1 Tax=Burkholderia TaxID=32008 RepID=UPI0015896CB9|nr:hypothetical protein [Burkholderia ambifaria]
MSEANPPDNGTRSVDAAHAEFAAGVAAHHEGRTAGAVTTYRVALAADHAGALNNLGIILEADGAAADAEEAYRVAVSRSRRPYRQSPRLSPQSG